MNGLFFEAGEPCEASIRTGSSLPPTDLTCYRRNMFKVNAVVSIPQTRGYLMLAEDQSMEGIVGLHAQIQATESMKNRQVDLVRYSSKYTQPDGTEESQPLSVSISLDQPQASQPAHQSPFRGREFGFESPRSNRTAQLDPIKHTGFVSRWSPLYPLVVRFR